MMALLLHFHRHYKDNRLLRASGKKTSRLIVSNEIPDKRVDHIRPGNKITGSEYNLLKHAAKCWLLTSRL
jgi:hypothetical protein